MKKILICLLLVLLITGCGKKKEQEKVQELPQLPSQYENIDNTVKEEIGKIENLDIPEMQDIDTNMLSTEYGLNLNLVENYISGISTTDEYKLYIAIKPKEGKGEIVKRAISNYFENLEMKLKDEVRNNSETQETISEEEITSDKLTLVRNRLETEVNGYYVYIVSASNEEILNVIKTKLNK